MLDLRKNRQRLKKASIITKPNDSRHNDFNKALADYLYKELKHSGINVYKKNIVLSISLKNKVENKYEKILVDCLNGKLYLRGNEVKDKLWGRLRRFEGGQRASDAYHCVVQSAKRIINRIKKLEQELNIKHKEITAMSNVVDMRKNAAKVKYSDYKILDLRKRNKLKKSSSNIVDLRKKPRLKKSLNKVIDLRKKSIIKYSIANSAKYPAKKMITIKEDYLDEGHEGWEAGSFDVTRNLIGTIHIDHIKDFPGQNGEIRKWHVWNDHKFFGNYPEEEWDKFLEDIKQNGIQYELMIWVKKDGSIVIAEGNHRIQACIQLGITEIPIDIRFFGNSQKFVSYFDE